MSNPAGSLPLKRTQANAPFSVNQQYLNSRAAYKNKANYAILQGGAHRLH